jgi:hypothetical protein
LREPGFALGHAVLAHVPHEKRQEIRLDVRHVNARMLREEPAQQLGPGARHAYDEQRSRPRGGRRRRVYDRRTCDGCHEVG